LVNLLPPVMSFVQGLIAGVVALIILSVRAAIEGRPGPTFADVWTAVAVGVAIGLLALVTPIVIQWQVRRMMRRGFRAESIAGTTYGIGAESVGPEPSTPRGGMDRFDRFTDRARKVLTLSQDEAQRFNHNYIGTEHLLLGLVREEEGVAARVLAGMNVELGKVRTVVEFIIGRGDTPVGGEVGLTPRAKRVMELAIDEARGLGHNHIGTEHLLLGLVREGEGIAAGVLESLGVNLDRARHEVLRVISAGSRDDEVVG
jgi:hypothetical protein